MAPAGGSPSVTFAVDLDQLATLKSRVNAIRRDLLDVSGAPGRLGAATATGAATLVPDLDRAINAFVEGWTHGRTVIEDELNDLVSLLGLAMQTYSTAEASIADASGGSRT